MSAAWEDAVKAVAHADGCPYFFSLAASHPHFAAYVGRCTCDRDARIAKGIKAALDAAMDEDYTRQALAAFKEAAR